MCAEREALCCKQNKAKPPAKAQKQKSKKRIQEKQEWLTRQHALPLPFLAEENRSECTILFVLCIAELRCVSPPLFPHTIEPPPSLPPSLSPRDRFSCRRFVGLAYTYISPRLPRRFLSGENARLSPLAHLALFVVTSHHQINQSRHTHTNKYT